MFEPLTAKTGGQDERITSLHVSGSVVQMLYTACGRKILGQIDSFKLFRANLCILTQNGQEVVGRNKKGGGICERQ